ncbi:hypothetical protein DER44DRAFT_758859 [Fusarium oxysporum]|nr:hypothetical protein DER44DRAFT_758859 [Fusarium oxysporum]
MGTANHKSCIRAVSAADGLLASLLYLNQATPVMDQRPNAGLFILQNLDSWASLYEIRINLERCRNRLIKTIPALGLEGLDTTLDSFISPIRFYEAAIFSFRNTLTGLSPDTLGNVVALCSLSHITSRYLHIKGNRIIHNILPDISLWRNTICNHEHRQAFSDLIEVLWSDATRPPYRILNPFPFQASVEIGNPLHSTYQAVPSNIPVAQNESVWDEFLASLDFFAIPDRQAEQNNHADSDGIQLAGFQIPDLHRLQGSAIITNLTYFLEDCGELVHILSGRGITAKDLHSYVSFNQNGSEIKNRINSSYIQPLQQDDSFKDSSVLGILSIVDRFVDLGYLQSIDEVREYMIIVGKEILPNDRVFVKFCQSVCTPADQAEMPVTSSHRRGLRPAFLLAPKPKIQCGICGKNLTTKYNMKRHIERKHPGPNTPGTPIMSVGTG